MLLWTRRNGGRGPHPRSAVRVQPKREQPVQVHIMGGNSLDILNARDISETGLGVYVPHRFEDCDVYAVVGLVISLPGRKSFLATGRVQHRNTAGGNLPFFGVQFTEIAGEHLDLVRSYILERLEDPAG
jgi:hypothetical protein